MVAKFTAEGFCKGLSVSTKHGRAEIENEAGTVVLSAHVRGNCFKVRTVGGRSSTSKRERAAIEARGEKVDIEACTKRVEFRPLYGYTIAEGVPSDGVLIGPFRLTFYGRDGRYIASVPLNVETIDASVSKSIIKRGVEGRRLFFSVFLSTSQALG